MNILSRPFVTYFRYYSKSYSSSMPFENLAKRNYLYFDLGRDAMLYGLIKSGFVKGDTVIFPAYICSSFLEPIINHGFKIAFVDIDKNLNLNLTHLSSLLNRNKSIKALVVVHYFGLPSNIDNCQKICANHNLLLIEDCCHGFLSMSQDHFIGEKGDIAIFSFRKSFACNDGGAILFNKSLNEKNEVKINSIVLEYNYLIERLLEFIVTKLNILNIYSDQFIKFRSYLAKFNFLKKEKQKESILIPNKFLSASLNYYLSNSKYLSYVSYKRNENWKYLLKRITKMGYRVLGGDRKNLIFTPSSLVVLNGCEQMVSYLRKSGIGAATWPGPNDLPDQLNYEDFPNTMRLSEKIVTIPIHQSILTKDKKRIINTLSKWKEMELKQKIKNVS